MRRQGAADRPGYRGWKNQHLVGLDDHRLSHHQRRKKGYGPEAGPDVVLTSATPRADPFLPLTLGVLEWTNLPEK